MEEHEEVRTTLLTVIEFLHDLSKFVVPFIHGSMRVACNFDKIYTLKRYCQYKLLYVYMIH